MSCSKRRKKNLLQKNSKLKMLLKTKTVITIEEVIINVLHEQKSCNMNEYKFVFVVG